MVNFEYRQSVSRARSINHHVIISQSSILDFQEEEILISITIFPSGWSQCHSTYVNYWKPHVIYSIGHSILWPKKTKLVGYLHALKLFLHPIKYSSPNHKVIVRMLHTFILSLGLCILIVEYSNSYWIYLYINGK